MFRETRLKVRASRPILVHTMGKVGSTTLYHRYKKMVGFPVLHTHKLAGSQGELEKYVVERVGAESRLRGHLVHSLITREVPEHSAVPAIVLSAVRDPFARNISAFFQNLPKKDSAELTVKKLITKFFDDYPQDIPTSWFDREFLEPLGIDVYGPHQQVSNYVWKPPHSATRHRKVSRRLTALVGRTEMLEELIREIDFELGAKNAPPVESANITQKKVGGVQKDKYTGFLETVRFPRDIGNRLLDSPLVKQFFDANETERMEDRWIR